MTTGTKNRGGRPLLGREYRIKVQIRLEPATRDKLRAFGKGNISRAVSAFGEQLPDAPSTPANTDLA